MPIGGFALMRLREGARWICTNAECHAEFIVSLSAKMEGASNPRCCCGSSLKQPYLRPMLTTIRKPEEVGRLRRLLEPNTT